MSIIDAYQHIPTPENHTNLLDTPAILDSVVPPALSDILDVPTAVSNIDSTSTVETVTNPTDTLTAVTMPDIVATVVDLLDSSAVTQSLEKRTSTGRLPLISTLPNLENTAIPDLTSIPNAVENLPVLAVAGALPDEVTTIENVISNELNNAKHKEIICYKKIADDITYFIFVPNTQKNYLSDAYETIIELLSAINTKLQEYFAKNNTESSTVVQEESAPSITE